MTQADPLSATLFALADPTRRSILARLGDGDATVNELAAPHDMTLAAVSKHIKVLENAHLVSRGRDGQFRPCHLEAAPLRDVAAWLEAYRQFWDRSLDRLAEVLKELSPPSPPRPAPRARRRTSHRKKKP
ncbi:MAG: metalloregulator ArsR/SmtB family transcription factor [Polyangiaceae bacterium]